MFNYHYNETGSEVPLGLSPVYRLSVVVNFTVAQNRTSSGIEFLTMGFGIP